MTSDRDTDTTPLPPQTLTHVMADEGAGANEAASIRVSSRLHQLRHASAIETLPPLAAQTLTHAMAHYNALTTVSVRSSAPSE